MDKVEALGFIGLKEPITEKAVQDRYAERFNYFKMLYTNASNRGFEKIQQQNLEKLNHAKKILLDEIAAKRDNFIKTPANPVSIPKTDQEKVQKKVVVGWLIVHTENKEVETFDLYKGINYLGRTKKSNGANNIVLENDRFISRTHAFIKCKETPGGLEYVLHDGDGSKPSANGVFLNGNAVRVNQYCSLKENDTVQIGITKLVFKAKKQDRSIDGEVEEVMQSGFVPTIDVFL